MYRKTIMCLHLKFDKKEKGKVEEIMNKNPGHSTSRDSCVTQKAT